MLLKSWVYLLSEVFLSLKRLYFLNTSKFKIIFFKLLFLKYSGVRFIMLKAIAFYTNVVSLLQLSFLIPHNMFLDLTWFDFHSDTVFSINAKFTVLR